MRSVVPARLFPDFNPIEHAFSKRKTHLLTIGARAFDPLVDAIGDVLATISAEDIAGSYRQCGFALPEPAPQPS